MSNESKDDKTENTNVEDLAKKLTDTKVSTESANKGTEEEVEANAGK